MIIYKFNQIFNSFIISIKERLLALANLMMSMQLNFTKKGNNQVYLKLIKSIIIKYLKCFEQSFSWFNGSIFINFKTSSHFLF